MQAMLGAVKIRGTHVEGPRRLSENQGGVLNNLCAIDPIFLGTKLPIESFDGCCIFVCCYYLLFVLLHVTEECLCMSCAMHDMRNFGGILNEISTSNHG